MNDFVNQSVNANQINGLTTLTGKLSFFEKGFIFKAQGVNSIINSPLLSYQDISEVKARNTLGVFPNGITVCFKNGKTYNYVVMNRNDIMQFLVRMKNTAEK